MTPQEEIFVTGTIRLKAINKPFTNGILHVTLSDSSKMDVAAQIVAKQTIHFISSAILKAAPLPFSFQLKEVDPRASYTVSVHIDVNSSGEISKGDYLTIQSYPVLTYGYPTEVDIEVECIN